MHRFAIAAASLIAATALINGCEQEPISQPEPEVVATAAVPEPRLEPERAEYFDLRPLLQSGDATPETVQEFLDRHQAGVNTVDYLGYTPLQTTARYSEDPEIFTLLIKAGADVNAETQRGWTPLHIAARFNDNPEIVTLLVKAGADLNAKEQYGQTPLDKATKKTNQWNAEVLRAAGGKRGKDLP